MAQRRISFSNYNRRLFPIGGREQAPADAMRVAQNVDALQTNSVVSRWGSWPYFTYSAQPRQVFIAGVDDVFVYTGAELYYDTTVIKSGFGGTPISFVLAPPQEGLPDYLFVCGGGIQPFKVNLATHAITNWGIVAPVNAANGMNVAWDQTVIDNLNASHTAWTPANGAAVSDDSTEFQTGTGSLKIVTGTTGPWRIVNDSFPYASPSTGSPLNLGTYANGDISLETDVIQFWVYYDLTGNATPNESPWLQIDFDVNDGTFKKDWYSFGIGFLNANNPSPAVGHNVNTTVAMQPTQWQQVTIAKSQFIRYGNELQLDWTNVQAVRFSGLIMLNSGGSATGFLLLDNLTMSGGCAMGAGPAVGNGGSEYDYYTVYRCLETGSQSNPSAEPLKVFNVADNKVKLTNIPLSSDPQVTARDLYRSQAGGGLAFYLDTIWDNTTTTYTDDFSDTSIPQSVTPWQPSVTVPPNAAAPYYITAGNGYYFLLITPGTTGAQPPAWVLPNALWTPLSSYQVGDTIAPSSANGQFWKVTAISGGGVSGAIQPPWPTKTSLGDTLTDGVSPNQITWTNQGTQETNDNGVVWQLAGLNSTNTLSAEEVLLDNAPPLSTYSDAVGPFQGSVFWARDTANPAYVYASPPGRPESVGQAYQMTSTTDATQKLSIWDGALWLHSLQHAFQITGSYPGYTPSTINDAVGTNVPLTVVPVQRIGIVYWAHDGIRIVNWSGSVLFGFAELGPIFRGQAQQDFPLSWSGISNEVSPPLPPGSAGPAFAALLRDEVVFSDGGGESGSAGTMTIALSYDGLLSGRPVWRQITPVLTAAVFDFNTGSVFAAWGDTVYYFEQPSYLEDYVPGAPAPIAFAMQTVGNFPDPCAQFTTQRIYLTANCNVSGVQQTLIPEIIIDGVATALPVISTNGRQTVELSPKLIGRFLDGFNLSGSLTGRVEVFRIELDIWLGEQNDVS